MNLTIKDTKKAVTATDLVVVFGVQGAGAPLPKGVKMPALASKAFGGEFRETRLTDALTNAKGGPAKRVLQIGLGKRALVDHERIRRAAAIATKKAEKTRAASVTLWVDPQLGKLVEPAVLGQALAEGAVMGSYTFTRFKSNEKGPYLKKVTLHGDGRGFSAGVKAGHVVGEANLFTRELQDTPGNLMRPRDLVAAARKVAARAANITLSVMDEKAMRRMKMGSLLSVSRGSEEPAYLIHLKYKPKRATKKKVCFVGKGLTFDAGGISLKPAKSMEDMKYDMSGGAAVLGAFHALAKLQPNVEIHGVVATSENLPDGKANKPGDLVTAMNGTTIEVLNTDAEGRLILADALVYADRKIKPDAMIDLATLTGAIVHGLGHELSAAMGNDDKLIQKLVQSGQRTGELVWHMPMLDCHKAHMKGSVGDLKNVNPAKGAGSLTAGAFLSKFVGKTKWVHLDIAGSAWGVDERDYQGGSTGTGVGTRLLLDFVTR